MGRYRVTPVIIGRYEALPTSVKTHPENMRNKTALPIQNRPPNPGKTTKNQPSPPNREGDTVPGGRFCSRRVILANPSSSPVNDDGKKPETTALARNYSLVKANQS